MRVAIFFLLILGFPVLYNGHLLFELYDVTFGLYRKAVTPNWDFAVVTVLVTFALWYICIVFEPN